MKLRQCWELIACLAVPMAAYASGCSGSTPSSSSSRVINSGSGSGGTVGSSTGSPVGTTGSSTGSTGSTGGGTSGSSSGSGGGSTSGSGSANAAQNQRCAALSTARACSTCCQEAHTAGIGTLVMDITACTCGANGMCESQCATEYCVNGTIAFGGDACDACIGNALAVPTDDGGAAGPCYNQIRAACMGNTDCAAYLTCSDPCNGLP